MMRRGVLALCLPFPGLSISQASLRTHAAGDQQASAMRAVEPADGDTFVGELTCSHSNVGLKVKVEKYPDDLRLEIFPKSYYDNTLTHRFCRPLTSCAASIKLTPAAIDPEADPSLHSDVAMFDPAPGSTELSEMCGWAEVGLSGTFTADSFHGGLRGDGTFRARDDLAMIERPMVCRGKEIDLRTKGRSITCSHFQVEKCKAAPPQRGEKAVFMILSTAGDQTGGSDGFLTEFGRKVSTNFPLVPDFDLAVSDDPTARAQVILVAPTARAMQTAYLAFGGLGLDIVLDANLMTQGDQQMWNKDNGERALKEMNATSLLEQYRQLYETTNEEGNHKGVVNLGSNKNRMARFRQVLLQRPEQRIFVVGHRTLFEDISMIPRGFGSAAMEIRVLSRNGQWRITSEPRCWN